MDLRAALRPWIPATSFVALRHRDLPRARNVGDAGGVVLGVHAMHRGQCGAHDLRHLVTAECATRPQQEDAGFARFDDRPVRVLQTLVARDADPILLSDGRDPSGIGGVAGEVVVVPLDRLAECPKRAGNGPASDGPIDEEYAPWRRYAARCSQRIASMICSTEQV